ncbi:MAG TPA: DUF2087 domain-containing protein [Candidatus Sulfomarinibacteraceae bacterium]|nr:DUF2087 domain-containing protein [Candidatus Sulfomarinibacteraceae bacterium]
MTTTMSRAEFEKRLEDLCTRGGRREWPPKREDQHVLLKSATLMLEPQREYSEAELNEPLEAWVDQVGQIFVIDHVTLRRFLVDAGYVQRDLAGQRYRINAEKAAEMFDDDVASVDPVAVVAEARRRIEERKRAYLNKRKDE